MTRLIGVGDNTVDTYVHQGKRYPGGNAVNVAVLARRCGHLAAYIGWLGSDRNGELVLDSLKAEGVDVSHCRVMDGPNAYSTVEVVNGERVFGPWDHGVSGMITLEEADYSFIQQFDVTHTSVFSNLEKDLPRLKAASRCLSFDFSNRREADYLAQVLPHVDIALISGADLSDAELEDMLRSAHAQGPKLVLMTRGGDGAWVFDGQTVYRQGVMPVKVVDTLGAGDAFAARFLVEASDGTPVQEAMRRAAETAAHNCTYYGAFGYGEDI